MATASDRAAAAIRITAEGARSMIAWTAGIANGKRMSAE